MGFPIEFWNLIFGRDPVMYDIALVEDDELFDPVARVYAFQEFHALGYSSYFHVLN